MKSSLLLITALSIVLLTTISLYSQTNPNSDKQKKFLSQNSSKFESPIPILLSADQPNKTDAMKNVLAKNIGDTGVKNELEKQPEIKKQEKDRPDYWDKDKELRRLLKDLYGRAIVLKTRGAIFYDSFFLLKTINRQKKRTLLFP